MAMNTFAPDEIIVLTWLKNIAKQSDQDILDAWTNLGLPGTWYGALANIAKKCSVPIDWYSMREGLKKAGYLDHLESTSSLSDDERENLRKQTAGARRQYVLDCLLHGGFLDLI